MKYNIIGSSSSGNCIIFNDYLMIDCGVPFKKVEPFYKDIKVVLLTHIHTDHFRKPTIKRIAFEKPNIIWVCGEWLVQPLVECGVQKKKICIVNNLKTYDFGKFLLKPIEVDHDVKNNSYLVDFEPLKLYYCTDTSSLPYLDCLKHLDYYFVERNFSRQELEQRIIEKEEMGEYSYERRVLNSHLSEEDTNEFLMEMMGENSQFVYCHQHIEKENENGR